MIKSILKRHASTLALAVAVSFTAALSARAQLIAYDGFSYAGVGNGTLTNASGLTYVDSTTSGGDSFGWAQRWTTVNSGPVTVSGTGLSYVDAAGNSLNTDGGSIVVGNVAGTTSGTQPCRTMAVGGIISGSGDSAIYAGITNTARTIWVSYIMQWIGPATAGSTTNLYVRKGDIAMRTGAIALAAGSGTATVTVGSPNALNRLGPNTAPYDTWSMWSGNDQGAGTANTGLAETTLALTDKKFVLMAINLTGDTSLDTTYTWFNWTNLTVSPLVAETPADLTNNSVNVDGFNSIRLDANSGNAAGTNTVLAFDEFRVGNTFGDVAPVPEPVTIALAGLGGLMLLALRRRRQ